MVVNIHEAKTQLSKLLVRISLGEQVVIAKNGHPVAELVPVASAKPQRIPEMLKGQIWMAEDWDSLETNADIASLFDGDVDPSRLVRRRAQHPRK